MFVFKSDKYKKVRGGHSRLLDISCAKCSRHLCYYQKDGSGILKRIYLDRVYKHDAKNKEFICPKCKRLLGVLYIYEKEKRPAYRLFAGAIIKKIIKASKLQ